MSAMSATSSVSSYISSSPEEQIGRAERFHQLHDASRLLRLVNAWDHFSARVFTLSGAPAIGTSSFAVALARGYWDGQQIPWAVVQEVVAVIVDAAGDLPVTADIESGRGHAPSDVETAVDDVISAGVVGVNIEDSVPESPGNSDSTGGPVRSASSRAVRRRASLASVVHQRAMRRILRDGVR